MQGIQNLIKKTGLLTVALSFVAFLVVGALNNSPKANAASLASRSMAISSSSLGNISTGAAGSGSNGLKAKYTFSFIPTATAISSMSIMFCTSPIPTQGTCTSPTGFDASHVASVQSTSFTTTPTLDTTTANTTLSTNTQGSCTGSGTTRTNCILLKWGSPLTPAASTQTIAFGGGASDYITNPTDTVAHTFFARITTYSDTAYTTVVDSGTTANSTATQVTITAKVQEALNFSVGTTSTAAGGACTAYTDTGALTLGDPNNGLSSTTSSLNVGHSYFRVSTNALNGTQILYSGDTLKSGANSITSVGESAGGTSSTAGTSQFGLAIDTTDIANNYSFTSLAAKTSPNNYALGNGTLASAKFQYNTASVTAPIPIATTSNVITCDTGSVQYVANIATNTPPGIYTTAVNYIATPTY